MRRSAGRSSRRAVVGEVSVMGTTLAPRARRVIQARPWFDPEIASQGRDIARRSCDAGGVDVVPSRRLYRLAHGRVLGGVASGLAEHLGLPVLAVRAAFVALTVAGGVGVLMYVAFWAVVPEPGGRAALGQSDGWLPFLALGAVAAGAMLGLQAIGVVASTSTALPMVAVVLGVALVWRQANEAQRARWRETARGRRGAWLRLLAGALLLGAGLVGFLASRG